MKTIKLTMAAAMLLILGACSQNKQKETPMDEKPTAKEKTLQKIEFADYDQNAYDLYANDWMLVTAGSGDSFNPMTISWGGLGSLWGLPVATIYIRPSRYTFEKMENSKYFVLTAFDEEYREKLQFIGSHSGRDMDKVKETNLTPLKTELGNEYYKEARLVIECEKIYYNDLNAKNILDTTLLKHYKTGETPHRMYIGKILNVWEKK